MNQQSKLKKTLVAKAGLDTINDDNAKNMDMNWEIVKLERTNQLILSTKFMYKTEHNMTWLFLGKKTENQIDYVMISKKRERMVQDITAYREVNGDRYLHLVIVKMKLRIIDKKLNMEMN